MFAFRQATRKLSTTSARRTPIYELRTYDVAPAQLGRFLALTEANIAIRTGYSPLLGYWTSELGAVSQVVHLWQYESYAERTKKNIVLNAVPWCPIVLPAATGGVYELRQYAAKPGALGEWQAAFQKGFPARCAYSRPVGIWLSEFGPLNNIVHLWRYDSLDDRMDVRARALKDAQWPKTVAETMPFIQTMDSKALVPTAWSPLK